MVGGSDPYYLKYWVKLERNRWFWTDIRS